MNAQERRVSELLERLAQHAPTTMRPLTEMVATSVDARRRQRRVALGGLGLAACLGAAIAVFATRADRVVTVAGEPVTSEQGRTIDSADTIEPADNDTSDGATNSGDQRNDTLVAALRAAGVDLPGISSDTLAILDQSRFCGVSDQPDSYDDNGPPSPAALCFLDAAVMSSPAILLQRTQSGGGEYVRIARVTPDGSFDVIERISDASAVALSCAGIIAQDVTNASPPPPGRADFFKIFSCSSVDPSTIEPVADSAEPAWFLDRDPLPSCGAAPFHPDNNSMTGLRLSTAARTCINNALSVGDAAELAYRVRDNDSSIERSRWYRTGNGAHKVIERTLDVATRSTSWVEYTCTIPMVDGEGYPVMADFADSPYCTITGPVCPVAEKFAAFLNEGAPTYDYTPSESPSALIGSLGSRGLAVIGTVTNAERVASPDEITAALTRLTIDVVGARGPKAGSAATGTNPAAVIATVTHLTANDPPPFTGLHVLAYVSSDDPRLGPESLFLACSLDEPTIAVYFRPLGSGWGGLSSINEIFAALTD